MSDRDVGIVSEEIDGVWVSVRHKVGYFRFSKNNPNNSCLEDVFILAWKGGGSWTPEETLLFPTILRDW